MSLVPSFVNKLFIIIFFKLKLTHSCHYLRHFYVVSDSDGKAYAYNAGDPGSIPGLGRSSAEGNGNPLQYSCLENPMDGGSWQATVHGVAKSRTRLSDFTFFLSKPAMFFSSTTLRMPQDTRLVCCQTKNTWSGNSTCEKYIYVLIASLLSTNWDNILLIRFKFRHVFSV